MLRSATLIILLAWGSHSPLWAGENPFGPVPTDPSRIAPRQKGDKIPDGDLWTLDGKKVRLKVLVSERPTLLVFYRGGWCPYCNTHLAALGKAQKDLAALGFQVLAVSPDDPERLRETSDRNDLPYTLLSDSSMGLTKKFRLAFRPDLGDPGKDRKLNDRLGKASGGLNKGLLPVPAAYLISQNGRILFSHHDPDYKKRIDIKALLRAAGEHLGGK